MGSRLDGENTALKCFCLISHFLSSTYFKIYRGGPMDYITETTILFQGTRGGSTFSGGGGGSIFLQGGVSKC